MNQMRAWLLAATAEEKRMLAAHIDSSVNYLHILAADPSSKHSRRASAETGAMIEHYTSLMHKASGGRLPIVYRTDLVTACSVCPYAQKCLGERATMSEFRAVTPELLAAIEDADSEGGDHD